MPEPPANDRNLIDWPAALKTALDDPQLLWEVVEAFLLEAPEAIAHLLRAVEQTDAKDLGFWAHRVNGLLRPFVCAEAAADAWELEQMSTRLCQSDAVWAEEDVRRAEALSQRLEQQMNRIVRAMQDRFQTRSLPKERS